MCKCRAIKAVNSERPLKKTHIKFMVTNLDDSFFHLFSVFLGEACLEKKGLLLNFPISQDPFSKTETNSRLVAIIVVKD